MMDAMCPHCKGTGKVQAQMAEGEGWSRFCQKCATYIGGCITGGNSPISQPPPATPCPFCDGPTYWQKD